jgi:DNA-binding response OmpR family regulator
VERILVIHDDPGSRQLDQILVQAGYDVVAVAYPPVAIMDAFLTTRPVLVGLDIGLSGKKPVEDLCRQLRKESKEVPFFVLGSTSEVADRVSLLDLGADDYCPGAYRARGRTLVAPAQRMTSAFLSPTP